MNNIVIFSGTTEGRRLSDMLSEAEIRHVVCVASEYGREMMEDNPYASVRVGRMDAEEMRAFFADISASSGRGIVVDATHPYATEVTANIREAAGALSVRYLRVARDAEEDGDFRAREACSDRNAGVSGEVYEYADIAACAAALEQTKGNILLTTGSKELQTFADAVSDETKKRTYVRVLPSVESIRLCEQAGIERDHIIAMQGPFGVEMNEAILSQYEIKHLVTKESGAAGGFPEKVEAAARVGARVHVIARPAEDAGVSVEEAYRILTGEPICELADAGAGIAHAEIEAARCGSAPEITLIGIGMGSNDCMTAAAGEALRNADAVFGAARLLQGISHPKKYEMYLASDIIPVLEREQITSAAIVFSGDTGFYSGAKGMIKALREWHKDIEVQVLPGISSFAYLAAKLGESYEDAVLCSVHGKKSEADLLDLIRKVCYHAKVFVLLSGAGDISEIAARLCREGIRARMIVGTDLSYENETIRELSVSEAAGRDHEAGSGEGGPVSGCGTGPATLLILNEEPEKRLLIPVKKDDDLIRDNVPMTKACIRHESIIRLNLRAGDRFYDIGGGTGSVAIEAASLDGSLQVTTIEKKKEAADLIRRNVESAGLGNVTVIEGNAEEVLPALPRPDCVFIGGSGGKLKEIMEILRAKGSGIRCVITAVSMETISEVQALLDTYTLTDVETLVLQVSDVQQAGTHHMLKAQNPVWIFAFTM